MGQPKDRWDKCGMFVQPLGGIMTAIAVACVGFYGSSVLDRNQARDTDARLYAQLMSQREGAETQLRKDMFNSILSTFLKGKPDGYDYEQQVLNLELLACNFHEALDIAPLFKDVYLKIKASKDKDASLYMRRLEKVAADVKAKQIAALEESGGKLDASISLDNLDAHLDGVKVIDGVISSKAGNLDPALQQTRFRLDALYADPKRRELRVKLEVRPSAAESGVKSDEVSSIFSVSPFDFPMIDNTRLPHGQRAAIVVRRFDESSVEITLVYFPSSRASLKEKPFYDETMHDLLYARNKLINATQ